MAVVGWAFAGSIVGCSTGDTGPETYPVSGTVTYKGEPASGVNLTFLANGDGVNAQAMTDDAGAFEVYTSFDMGKSEKPGMAVGDYQVTATKLDKDSIKSQTTMRPPKGLLPRRYSNPDSSGLTATIVAKKDNHLVFDLD